MKTAVIYARYSSERQTEQSIEGQVRECTEYAARNDIVIIDTYIDRAMTGTNDNRTDFQRMIKDCSKRAWDIILVYKFDRFSRNKYETAIHKKTLRDNGIKLISVKENIPDSPEGIILESLLEGMAEYYSAELSQKVRRGMRETRIKGNYTGGHVMYGYKVENNKYVIHEEEASVVRRIFNQFAANVYVKDIISDLHKDGITNRGKPFARNTVYKMLKNEKYNGVYRYGDEVYTELYPRIVPEDIFEMVRVKTEENKYGKHDSEVIYLLKNKLRCGCCGKTMVSESGTSKAGIVKRYYKCSGRKHSTNNCTKGTIRKEDIEEIVLDTTLKILNNKELIYDVASRILEAHKQRVHDVTVLNLLLEEKEKIEKGIANIMVAIEQGIITNTTKKRMTELEEQLDIVEAKILTERSKAVREMDEKDIIKYLQKAVRKDAYLMIRLLVKEIKLYDDKIEIYYNLTDRKNPDDFEHQDFSFYEETVEMTAIDYVTKGDRKTEKLALILYA